MTTKDGSGTMLNAVHEWYLLTFITIHKVDIINVPTLQFQKSKYLLLKFMKLVTGDSDKKNLSDDKP